MDFQLSRIGVANFRGVATPVILEFDRLPAGLYFIRGRNDAEPRLGSNGAGKSTLFDEAISWALTGRVSRSQRPGSAVENWNVVGKKTEVSVAFSLGGSEHIVVRTRNPNGLFLDGQKVEQREIDDLLPLTDAALHRTVVIDQFNDLFLSLKPEEKSRMFSEALNLDRWLVAADKAGDAGRAAETQARETENGLISASAVLGTTKAQITDLEAESEKFEEEKAHAVEEAREKAATAARSTEKARRAAEASRKAKEALGGADKRTQAEEARSKLRKYEKALGTDRAVIAQAEREIAVLEKRWDAYENSTDPICPECGAAITDKHRAEKVADINAAIKLAREQIRQTESGIKDIEAAIMRAEKRIEKLEEDLESYTVAVREDDARRGELRAAERNQEWADKDLYAAENRVNTFTRQIELMHERRAKAERTAKTLRERLTEQHRLVDIYKFWQRGFRDIRLEQLDDTLLELEVAANRHAESLGLDGWEVRFATEREKKGGGVSHGFSVLLYPPGQREAVPFESYSGGESQRWQLAVTFGLAEVLLARSGLSPDFEVIDEPTRGLSAEGIDDLLECLRTRASETGRRIFFIDHNSLDRGSFDGVITVIKDHDGSYLHDPQGLVSAAQQRVREKL